MATPSPRNFSQYSGLDQFKQMQTMPSAYDRLQNPSLYGPGSERDQLLKSQYSWAAPLSERPATASGRSYNDPERIMERRMRDGGGGGGGGYAPPGITILPKQSGRALVANAMFPNTKGYLNLIH